MRQSLFHFVASKTTNLARFIRSPESGLFVSPSSLHPSFLASISLLCQPRQCQRRSIPSKSSSSFILPTAIPATAKTCVKSLRRGMCSLSETLPNIVFVLGGPGAGKGTQCSKIVETYGFEHLSAGDLLREERNKPGSEYGELIEGHIRGGTIVPVEITCSLIERAMDKSGSNLFLIDGFPRNQNNLEGWEKQMSEKVNILFVLFFDAPEAVCVDRCLSRGQAGSGRSDDNPDSLKKRVNTYVNDTMPIIDHFMKKDLVRKVDASKSPEEVFDDVREIFGSVNGLAASNLTGK